LPPGRAGGAGRACVFQRFVAQVRENVSGGCRRNSCAIAWFARIDCGYRGQSAGRCPRKLPVRDLRSDSAPRCQQMTFRGTDRSGIDTFMGIPGSFRYGPRCRWPWKFYRAQQTDKDWVCPARRGSAAVATGGRQCRLFALTKVGHRLRENSADASGPEEQAIGEKRIFCLRRRRGCRIGRLQL